MDISREAESLVVASEVTSRTVYDRRYANLTLPGVNSGITAGIGYDLGQSSATQIKEDWAGKVDSATLKALMSCANKTGAAAREHLPSVGGVRIDWDTAMLVFEEHDVPRYLNMCSSKLPNFDRLHPDCKGALFSLVYNRGASFNNTGPRFAEMRAIKECMRTGDLAGIPVQIRAMKRIWAGRDDARGLLIRRDKEAELFERGLRASHPAEAELVKHRPAPHDATEVANVQKQLRELGYVQVGRVDGLMGARTKGAILAFRQDYDLPLVPVIDDDMRTALTGASPIEPDEHRANATLDDVKAGGSKTLEVTEKAKGWAGKIIGSSGGLGSAGVVAGITAKLGSAKALKDSVLDLGIPSEVFIYGGIVLGGLVAVAAVGLVIWFVADKIEKVRLADYRSGKNT